jgi:hypothetical protein
MRPYWACTAFLRALFYLRKVAVSMAWQGKATSPRTAADRRMLPSPLISLVGRLIVAQAGASAAIGLGYIRRNMPWLVLSIVAAVALCALAGLVRRAVTPPGWLP